MNTPTERFTFRLPDDGTPEHALAAFELLNDVTDAIWQRYQPALLRLIDPPFHADTDPQPDLFPPDDALPFRDHGGGPAPAAVAPPPHTDHPAPR